MRTDRKTLKLAGAILLRCLLVGALFAGAGFLLKQAPFPVLLVGFLVPVAAGVILIGFVISTPARTPNDGDGKEPTKPPAI